MFFVGMSLVVWTFISVLIVCFFFTGIVYLVRAIVRKGKKK
jgi:hypothetical protein